MPSKPWWDPLQEIQFMDWYTKMANQRGLNPNPDDPRHFYDYRGAYEAGVRAPNQEGHWPSEFKLEGHPRMVLGGVNTKTGLPQQSPNMMAQDDPQQRLLMLLGDRGN